MPYVRILCVATLSLALANCGGSGNVYGASAPGSAGSTAATTPAPAASSTPRATSPPAPVASPSADATAGSQSVPFPSATDSDPFYAQPISFPNTTPGTIIASRSVTYEPIGGAALPNPAWQLKFVSQDGSGAPIAAIATVVKPMTSSAVGTVLLAALYAEDSLGSQCAPSHSVTSTANSQDDASIPVALGLDQGWTLVYPDHEGPQSEYAAGRIAGQIALDSIRAAEHFTPLGLSSTTKVGLEGYSGGGVPAAWAATLQKTYAPELNIVGIASGGTPANPEEITENINTDKAANAVAFALIFSATIGVNRGYPELLANLLNAKGIAAAKSLANGCAGDTTGGAPAPSGVSSDYTTVANTYALPQVQMVLPLITLPLAGHSPMTDVFVYHSQLDELIPIAGVDAMVSAWCSDGSTISYYRGATGEHVTFEYTGQPFAFAYLTSRFAGTQTVTPPTTTTCNG